MKEFTDSEGLAGWLLSLVAPLAAGSGWQRRVTGMRLTFSIPNDGWVGSGEAPVFGLRPVGECICRLQQ